MSKDTVPNRRYQVELVKTALEKNTIIFLPSGSGKTFIALLVLKQMSRDLQKSYSAGGKISILLVNTLVLVEQYAKYIEDHTTLRVGRFTGDMNLDSWEREKWKQEFDLSQVVVMTSQVLINISNQNFIDLRKVNLIVIDECHRGANDQLVGLLMKHYGNIEGEKPRVLGLTAPLLNCNVNPHSVMDSILALETTYQSKVATVGGLATVVGYSTNPREELKICHEYHMSFTEAMVIKSITESMTYIESLKSTFKKPNSMLKKVSKALNEVILHIKCMGTYGGMKAILAHTIQLERLKQNCSDSNIITLNYVQTILSFGKELLLESTKMCDERDRIFRFSSEKVLLLLNILKKHDKENMSCLIFTRRRFTAKVIFYILEALSKCDPEYSHIKANFMVGYNMNIHNVTRESLFISKKNKGILNSFINNEVNVLVASNVLEEGVELKPCTMVVMFDKPEEYRAYVQTKGRARNRDSLFYIIVEESELEEYAAKYEEFQLVEKTLNEYLLGMKDGKLSDEEEEEEEGADSQSPVMLLRRYCDALPSDPYTANALEWREKRNESGEISVAVLLPTCCPLKDATWGPFVKSEGEARRAAAAAACEKLRLLGELDEHLSPTERVLDEEEVGFLFEAGGETVDAELATKRMHRKLVASCLRGRLDPHADGGHFLHAVRLRPRFPRRPEDVNGSAVYDAYASTTCFGLVTRRRLPAVCDFSVFVTAGAVDVRCQVNGRERLVLSEEEALLVRTFHWRVFQEVLAVLQPFLMIDDEGEDGEGLFVVPIDKTTLEIDFAMMSERSHVNKWSEPSTEEKMALEVTQDTYLRRIVVPWYRADAPAYVVTEVSLNRSARSEFPNLDYGDFKSYFEEKHHLRIVNPDLPQLLVKALTKRLNFIKPFGGGSKKREKMYEEGVESLLPELVVKQEFPADLWIQASLLPTILHRLTSLLAVEEVRCKIAEEAGVGVTGVSTPSPLLPDEHLLDSCHRTTVVEEDKSDDPPDCLKPEVALTATAIFRANTDLDQKLLEAQYPWKDEDEPKDVERELTATVMDVAHYEAFLTHPVNKHARGEHGKSESSARKFGDRLALTYPRRYAPRRLRTLERAGAPELRDLYAAATAAAADDVVAMERFATLGDAFLRYVATAYVTARFPALDEARAADLRGRMLARPRLYRLAVEKNLDGILRHHELSPRDEWLPPGFRIPPAMRRRIDQSELSVNALFDLALSPDEQIAGQPSQETLDAIGENGADDEEEEDACFRSMAPFLGAQFVDDKTVADLVDAMVGVYVHAGGTRGGLRFIEWLGLIPPSEKLEVLLETPRPSDSVSDRTSFEAIDRYIPNWRELEDIFGYEFSDPRYLLRALTHPSFTLNRSTEACDALATLGAAVLDWLTTCHLHERPDGLAVSALMDLRCALSSGALHAAQLVRLGAHKFALMANGDLQSLVDRFARRVADRNNFQLDEEVLVLLDEDDIGSREAVDVPKILGHMFEAIAGAIYLDSGHDLKTVWDVFYKITWKEIDLFSHNVPKNIVRRLHEWPGAHHRFGTVRTISTDKCMVPLSFMLNGTPKVVHGFGKNKASAQKAAAKLALRFLDLDISKY